MQPDLTVAIAGTPTPVYLGESTAAASIQAAAAATQATNAANSAAAAAASVSRLNGTLARFMDQVAIVSGTVSSTAQTALEVLANELWQTGLIDNIAYLNMRVGNQAAAARVPFVDLYGYGADTGTIGSWAEANGLAGTVTLDTGVHLEKAGLTNSGVFMGMYMLNQFTSAGTTDNYVFGMANPGVEEWGFNVSGSLSYFDTWSGGTGRAVGYRLKLIGGVDTYPTMGLHGGMIDAAGVGSIWRDGLPLTQSATTTAPVRMVLPASSVHVYTTNNRSGGEVIMRDPSSAKVAMISGMMRRFNNAVGRTITAEELA